MIGELVLALEAVAPSRLAAEWDRVGFLLGDASRPLRSALLCIDLTEQTLSEAIRLRCQAIVAYHPPIFEPIHRLTTGQSRESLLLRCAEHRMALLSPHTALDAVQGGVTDWLTDAIGRGERWPITPASEHHPRERLKVVTFVPAYAVHVIRDAMVAAGAGHIGGYTACGFESAGIGTFIAGAGTKPTIGKHGRLERVPEVRLEMVCSEHESVAVIRALRQAHPYETPPVELHQLKALSDSDQGHGRIVRLDRPLARQEIVTRLRRALRIPKGTMQIVEGSGKKTHSLIGVVPGAGFSMFPKAVEQGCSMFITGEARHHDQLAAHAQGCDVVLAGHSQTERGFLPHLARLLQFHLPKVRMHVSRVDAPPAKWA